MAKKTKAADLSIEEKLEQALIVPGYEPYKIPDNWCWTTVGTVTNIYRGVSYKKNEGHSEKHMNDCLVLRGGNIQEGSIDTETDNVFVNRDLVSGTQIIRKYDVIIVSSTGSKKVIGRAGISFSDYSDVAFGAFLTLVRANDYIYKPFIAYYLQSDIYRNRIRTLASGVNINNIRNEYITETPLSLPPLPEQQRIVERIESLFSKLDEAKEKAQEVIDSFEIRKAAILHKAFSGELTAKWREENGVGIESWESTKIGNMLTEIKYGTSEKSDYSFDGIPVFRIPNIGDMTLIFDDVKKIQRQECSENECLSENDILIIRSNGSKELVGKCALVPKINFKCTYASFLIRLRMKDSISSLYTVWYLTSEQTRKQLFNKAKSSAGIHNINSKEISDISIVVPSKPEQNIITATLERLITKEKETVIFAESVIDQIDAMKKAILARAFRGELGTNDPEEESAVELLKQILSGE